MDFCGLVNNELVEPVIFETHLFVFTLASLGCNMTALLSGLMRYGLE